MHNFGMGYDGFSMFPVAFGGGIILLVLWSLAWKGFALWRAAKRDDMIWFIIFLVLNTAGILEIIYIFLVTGAKLSDLGLPGAKKEEGSHHAHEHHN